MKKIRIIFYLTLTIVTVISSCNAQSEQVDVVTFEKGLSQNNTTLLDVRTPEEYHNGHIAKAINMDVNAAGFSQQILSLDKSHTILVYCKSGKRSARAAGELRGLGYTVIDLAGGIGAWMAAQKPIMQ
jgi:rhodanese-related sulfurtransferase